MSSLRIRSGGGDEEYSASAQELLLQERLQILLKRLRWSYAALWTLNPHTRLLQWTGGHYLDTTEGGAGWAAATSTQPKQQLDWLAQQFYSSYKSCAFAPGSGFVGRANLGRRHIWLSGDSIVQNADSLEQSQFLSPAKIKSVMCVPWLSSVLELGTTDFVGENCQLMDQIQQVLCHDLLSVTPLHDDSNLAGPGFVAGGGKSSDALQGGLQQPAHTELPLQHLDPAQLNQSASHELYVNISDPVWRPDMIFMEEHDLAAAWRAVGVGLDNQSRAKISATASTSSSGLMNFTSQGGVDHQSYASAGRRSVTSRCAAATASSSTNPVSSCGSDHHRFSVHASPRPAAAIAKPAVSPSQRLHHHIMQSLLSSVNAISSRSTPPPPPDSASSTRVQPRLEACSVKHEPHFGASKPGRLAPRSQITANSLRRTTSFGDQYEIQKALSVLEALESTQTAQHQQAAGSVLNSVSEAITDPISDIMDTQYCDDQTNELSTFHLSAWHHHGFNDLSCLNTSSASSKFETSEGMMSSACLRKQGSASGDKMMNVPRAGQLQRRHTVAGVEVLKEVETYQQEFAATTLKQANSLIQNELDFQPAISHFQEMNTSHVIRGRGRAASHDEAALNHMMAERRRRLKQKENFATLRRLVPIISKADKASTLVDAIVYLKDLQNTIVEMKANETDMVRRCEDLASKCLKLEEQNQKLVEILSTDKPPR